MTEIKVQPECIPCFFKQMVIALQESNLQREEKLRILQESLKTAARVELDRTPAHATTEIHRWIRRQLGTDPFKERKHLYNSAALQLYPEIESILLNAEEPLKAALRLAVAGNSIDLGIFKEINVRAELEKATSTPMVYEEYELFQNALSECKTILYLLDNAGEIVFDRLLIELLKQYDKEVIAVVKGGPIINDATMEDAIEVGLTDVCRVVDNGSDAVGTIIQWCSEDFRRLYLSADMVISKGQGNFETLFPPERDVFFLFQIKCDVVADYIHIRNGERLLASSGTLKEHKSGAYQGIQR